ncbi:tetratricopeptide repeat protein [Bacillus sp. FJAT-27251]|uniref:tetratricopeptide repeat protein n=1 Tax=Bacillus sp. FJAT-27251 TaxID=1684142 RepID=UPI0006A7A1FA|nr:tetratricopeptide repeat protein [Bacillus sp. FJAT-27251]
MTGFTVNPLLISVLTKRELSAIPPKPSLSDLPGRYAKVIFKNLNKIKPPLASNFTELVCKSCGKSGEYDIGMMAFNVGKGGPEKPEQIEEFIQITGYFRCSFCNSAGNWETTNDFMLKATSFLMMYQGGIPDHRCSFGEYRLYDGSSHRYATDREEHLLAKLKNKEEDEFIWNRLGNLYHKGNRADLAVCAFERSIELNPMQTESLYTLGLILSEAGESEEAAHFFHRMLLTAKKYTRLSPNELRDYVTSALIELLDIASEPDMKRSLVPPRDLADEFWDNPEEDFFKMESEIMNADISTENFETLYPLAELYMGPQRFGLSRKKIHQLPSKNKKKKKRKK